MLSLRADWRRRSYALALGLCFAGVACWPVVGGPGPVAAFGLVFLLLVEIPRRRLLADAGGITLASWRGTRRIGWGEVAGIAPAAGGWFAINRQLPAAAVLMLHGGEQVRVFDVWPMRPAALVAALRAAMAQARA